MPIIKGARFRTGAAAGVNGDTKGYGPFVTSGTPGTTYMAGTAEKGGKSISTTDGKWYKNTGTKASPVWTEVS
jgi:hypothetical protein